ncbi:MAG: DUF1778 domain-containing protein [Phycisphaeraceae bacterium]|nr:MAG: DUF1778 domain-containing protein [Phycisphaeraceae bacterium]
MDATTKITIQQPTHLKAKIKQAAALRGMTVTSFINSTLELVADRTIKRVRERELTERDSRALMEMLQSPGEPSKALRRAAARSDRSRSP